MTWSIPECPDPVSRSSHHLRHQEIADFIGDIVNYAIEPIEADEVNKKMKTGFYMLLSL